MSLAFVFRSLEEARRETAVADLRTQLRAAFPDAFRPIEPCKAIPTGWPELDGILPGGGIRRGTVSEWIGEIGSGRLTVLRNAVVSLCERGGRAAVVDADRTLCPESWVDVGYGAWIVRPREASLGPWAAETLIRHGRFDLVALSGVDGLSSGASVRLRKFARYASLALVVLTSSGIGGSPCGSAILRSHFSREGDRLRVRLARGGPAREAVLDLPPADPLPLYVSGAAPDRRAAARGKPE